MIFCGDIALPKENAIKIENIPLDLCDKNWCGNLEGSLISDISSDIGGVYNSCGAIKQLCEKVNFSMFNIANNHLLDGARVDITINNIKRLGKEYVGAGLNIQDAEQPKLFNDGNDQYSILSFGWECIQCKYASKNKQGVNPLRREHIFRSVKLELDKGHKVVCFMHWDYELELYPQPYDRRLAHDLIDLGVNAVIGCHAHRVQQVEIYKDKPIVYGLGNFLFYQGYYNKNSSFPKCSYIEWAFEYNKGENMKIHEFSYNKERQCIKLLKSYDLKNEKFYGIAEYTNMTDKEYEIYFAKHRIQRKLLPIFKSKESQISYILKSKYIKMRGFLIKLLLLLRLKKTDRSYY